MVASLRCALHVAVQQNNELRARLQKIRSEAEVAIEGPNLTMSLELDLNASARLGHHSLSYSSSCVSQSEFFDAKEYLTDVAVSDSSSDASETEMEGENEAEEEGSVSEASEMGNEASNDPGFFPPSCLLTIIIWELPFNVEYFTSQNLPSLWSSAPLGAGQSYPPLNPVRRI